MYDLYTIGMGCVLDVSRGRVTVTGVIRLWKHINITRCWAKQCANNSVKPRTKGKCLTAPIALWLFGYVVNKKKMGSPLPDNRRYLVATCTYTQKTLTIRKKMESRAGVSDWTFYVTHSLRGLFFVSYTPPPLGYMALFPPPSLFWCCVGNDTHQSF